MLARLLKMEELVVAVAITAGPECLPGTRVAGTVRTERPAGKCVPTFG